MQQEEITGALASGSRYRVTPFYVLISNPAGEITREIPRDQIGRVERQDKAVALFLPDTNVRINLVTDTFEDALQIEQLLRSTGQHNTVQAQDFTSKAVLALVLYFVLFIPGLIVNLVYLDQANRAEEITGKPPDGKGCLQGLLAVFIGLPLIGTVLAGLGVLAF